MFRVSCFLFSFSRLFPLPDTFSGVLLTNARFSDRIRSAKRKIVSGTARRPTLQLSVETLSPLYPDRGSK